MPVKQVRDVPSEPVAAATGTTRQVLIGPDEGPNFALRKFAILPGGEMPAHTNTVEHEQYVLRGRARVAIGAEVHEVGPGSVVLIPAGVPHSYRTMGTEPFEFLCAVPNRPDVVRLLDRGADDAGGDDEPPRGAC